MEHTEILLKNQKLAIYKRKEKIYNPNGDKGWWGVKGEPKVIL